MNWNLSEEDTKMRWKLLKLTSDKGLSLSLDKPISQLIKSSRLSGGNKAAEVLAEKIINIIQMESQEDIILKKAIEVAQAEE